MSNNDLTPYEVTIVIASSTTEEQKYHVRAANENDATSIALRKLDEVLDSREDHGAIVEWDVESITVCEQDR